MRLLGYCGYGMNTDLFESLIWWTCAEECLSDDCWTWGLTNGHWTFDIFCFRQKLARLIFKLKNSSNTVQDKLNALPLRPFGLHSDVNDAHRAGANRLQTKQWRRHHVIVWHYRALVSRRPTFVRFAFCCIRQMLPHIWPYIVGSWGRLFPRQSHPRP